MMSERPTSTRQITGEKLKAVPHAAAFIVRLCFPQRVLLNGLMKTAPV